ncbi:MAG TPA: AAA family ATPase [Chitinophagaceae bacterium]|nr:AAA family ATPase [Chitinophagaceae bacterium]
MYYTIPHFYMELLEREHFLVHLQNVYDQAVSGQGNTVFIVGEAGIGKTALVKQFLQRIQGPSVQLVGYCDDLFTPHPLAPLYDIARQDPSGFPLSFTQESSQADRFVAFCDYLQQQTRTPILVFEDIHWADEATLDFIKYFARRVNRLSCLFILTWRDTEVHCRHPLYSVLGDLPPSSVSRLDLQPLSAAAVQQLAEQQARNGASIFHISAGNPFFVQELLHHGEGDLPQNIRDTVLAIYNREPESTRKAWQWLSLMPEGIELNRVAVFPEECSKAWNSSLEKKIIILKNERLSFRHELFRRSIASTLTPIDVTYLSGQLLQVMLPLFIAQQEWARIVHYARQAGDQKRILEYAPVAAATAARSGAHAESVKLYEAAIAAAIHSPEHEVLPLYEQYAYECYLTRKFEAAIAYTEKALRLYERRQEKESMGKSLRFLSRLWWFCGNRAATEQYAFRAIEVLADQPVSSVKAMAYSNLSQLYMLQKNREACLHWGEQAIAMARQLNDQEVLSHALNNTGSVQLKNKASLESGKALLEESLQLALANGYHEHAARAYTNLISILISVKEFDQARGYMEEGLLYCEERDLDSWTTYKLSWKARLLLETGEWPEALVLARRLLRDEQQAPVVKIGALVIRAVILMRQEGQDVLDLLAEAKKLAFATEEHQRIMPVMVALMELEWLTGMQLITEEEITQVTAMLKEVEDPCCASEFCFWLQRTGRPATGGAAQYDPYRLLEAGKTGEAAAFWMGKGCIYDAALCLFQGNEEEKRKAITLVQGLRATATARRMKQEMEASGIKKVPRGKRSSTLANPAQLTSREVQILQYLQEAASNKEIAAALFISAKTVDHHISSILFKLEAPSRSKAVTQAIKLGLLHS